MVGLSSHVQTVRRATVGRSVLGWAALLSLGLNAAFWYSVFVNLLAPPSLLSAQTVQAALMVVAYAVILPLFWSMLAPSSPAGRLLQKTQWATPGYLVTVAAAMFLTYHAGSIVLGWWKMQPAAAETGSALFLTITSLIAGVFVPALCWTVVTPEQWIAQIEQARDVRRIEHAMRTEEAAMRAAYARAVSLLNADLNNLTIYQRRELAGILGGFARVQQQAMQSIARSWKDMYGVEAAIATVPDQELLDGYKKVAELLAGGADVMTSSADYAGALELNDDSRTFTERSVNDRTADRTMVVLPHQEHNRTSDRTAERPNDWTTSGPVADHRTAERPNGRTPYEDALRAARTMLRGAWKSTELQELLSVSKSTAHAYLTAWIAAGLVTSLTEPKHHYQFSEEA